jgi:hypothetical protein
LKKTEILVKLTAVTEILVKLTAVTEILVKLTDVTEILVKLTAVTEILVKLTAVTEVLLEDTTVLEENHSSKSLTNYKCTTSIFQCNSKLLASMFITYTLDPLGNS